MTPEPGPAQPTARRRRRWAFVAIALTALAAGVYFGLLSGPSRPAGALVVFHINRVPQSLLPGKTAPDATEWESFRQSQLALVKSRLTLNSALKQSDTADLGIVRMAEPDPLAWLEGALQVSLDGSEFMRVELDGPPEEAVQVLAAVAHSYLKAVREREEGERRTRIAKLNEHLQRYRDVADQSRREIDKIAITLGAPDGWAFAIQEGEIARRLRISTDGLRQARMEHELAQRAADAKGGAHPDAGLAHRVSYWEGELAGVRRELARIGEQRVELEDRHRRVDVSQALADRIGREIEEMRVNLDSPSRVTLFEEPYAVSAR